MLQAADSLYIRRLSLLIPCGKPQRYAAPPSRNRWGRPGRTETFAPAFQAKGRFLTQRRLSSSPSIVGNDRIYLRTIVVYMQHLHDD